MNPGSLMALRNIDPSRQTLRNDATAGLPSASELRRPSEPLLKRIRKAGARRDESSVEFLDLVARQGCTELSDAALDALAALGRSESWAALFRLSGDPSLASSLRLQSILSRCRDEAAIEPLSAALEDQTAVLRRFSSPAMLGLGLLLVLAPMSLVLWGPIGLAPAPRALVTAMILARAATSWMKHRHRRQGLGLLGSAAVSLAAGESDPRFLSMAENLETLATSHINLTRHTRRALAEAATGLRSRISSA